MRIAYRLVIFFTVSTSVELLNSGASELEDQHHGQSLDKNLSQLNSNYFAETCLLTINFTD